jgi:hypothetical protein
MTGVSLFKALYDTQRVKVVVEAQTVLTQAIVERPLTSVAKGWMTDVVHQGQRLGEIDVEVERRCDVARYLRYLHRVGQATAKVVRRATGKDLCLAGKTSKGASLNDAVAVTLEGCPVVAGGRWKCTYRETALVFAEDTTGMQIVDH